MVKHDNAGVPKQKIETRLPVLTMIRRKRGEMTPTLQRIADLIVKRPAEAIKMSISQLAMETGTKSESSVVRFYRILGFSGYHDFKVTLATEIGGESFYHTYEDISPADDIGSITRKIFNGTIQTLHDNLKSVDPRVLQEALTLLGRAERLIFLGYASSGALAMEAFFKFSRLKAHCYFYSDSHINASLLAQPLPGDVIFCISHSGESKDVVIPAQQAKPVAKVIALTGSADSPLARIADVCIVTYSEEVNYRTEVMVSRAVQLSVIEVLFTALSMRQGPNTLERLRKSRQAISYLKY
jgi:RpiR family transcriptional regulator, carbohydrate utilization regulator